MTILKPSDLHTALKQLAFAAEAIGRAPAGWLLALNAEAVLAAVEVDIARAEVAIQNLRSAATGVFDNLTIEKEGV
ncbi:MAG TPA: hypothetical protein VD866_06385 [Urbifossiella sp.]|nr:hypothetical protein [Urbifossiella sp.]